MLPLAACLAFALVAEPPKPLTADERKELTAEWKKLNAAGGDAYGKHNLSDAQKACEQALAVAHRLYPKDDFPNGHRTLDTSLNNLAFVLNARGRYAEAEPFYRDSLDMRKRLYPKQDHPDVARSLCYLGFVLQLRGKVADAEPLIHEALEMNRRLYPKQDHPDVAFCLNDLAMVLVSQGKAANAETLYRDALDMRKRLYPKQDHLDVATSLSNLALVLKARGKVADAEPLTREALDMRKRLYPKQDHPDLARSLHSLAYVLEAQGKVADAAPLYRDALEMRQRLYPKQDHPEVAETLNNLAMVLQSQGKVADAEPHFRESVDMNRRLYPKQDHPAVAYSLSNLAFVLQIREKYADAELFYRDTLDMRRRLYPKQDHPDLAYSLRNLAFVLDRRGKVADAEPHCREALAMSRRLTDGFAGKMAEGDALTLTASLPLYRDAYLSNSLSLKSRPADVYTEVFADRGAISRVYEQKQLQARAAATDPTSSKLLAELADARVRRAELIHAPATKDKATLEKREEELKGFEKVIADKSEALSKRFAPVARSEKLAKATPTDLQKALPDGAVLIDLLKWTHFEYDPKKPGKDGEKRTPKYLAFVVTKTDVKWLDLGPADKIEEAVRVWREAITDSAHAVPADLGARVRELVWEPVRKELPKGTKEVYISPDAALCRLPWVALPGDKPGTVLLEDEFAIATVPHAPFLLDHLWERDASIKEKSELLVVGGVDFDAKFAGKVDPKAFAEERLLDPKAKPWGELKGTKAEADGLAARADKRKQPATLLSGDKATTEAVRAALPKAKVAHLATHGFFADAKFRSAFQLDEKDYRTGFGGERVGRAANSPLVMTGLVLAGANDPKTPGRGIVTGEGLIDLDLSGLELAVLSACETGLGDVAGGEGTFGLQRAFHTAGARNVVASLWSVSDAATAALMGEFYRGLWEEKLTPAQALKAAQLKVYRTDRKDFGTLRGFTDSGVKAEEKNFPPSKGGGVRNHPALWAAFTLSGPGK